MTRNEALARALTAGRQAKQGATLGFADEVQDAIGAALAKAVLEGMELTGTGGIKDAPTYANILAGARQRSQAELAQDWQDAPITSFGANVAGFVPFALGQSGLRAIGSAASPQALSGAANALARFNTGLQGWAGTGGRLARMGRGAAVGAGYGAVSGAGAAGDDLGERAGGAALGGALGGVLGGATGAIGRGVADLEAASKQAAREVATPTAPTPEQLLAMENLPKTRATQELLSQVLMRPDLAEMQARANALQTMANRTGVQLTLPEMLAQSTVDPLLAQQGILAKSPETAGQMQKILQSRVGDFVTGDEGSIARAFMGQSQQLAGQPATYDDLAQSLIKKGGQSAREISRTLQEQARPLYQQAEGMLVDAPILKDPLIQSELTSVLKNPTYQRELGEKTQPNSIKALDLVYKSLRDRARSLAQEGNREQARIVGGAAEQLVSAMDEAAPAYKQARSIYSSQPEMLANREIMGELANIDQLSPKEVLGQLYSGTQGTAARTAQALGPEGSGQAAALKLQDILGKLKSDTLPPKLSADQINILRAYAGDNADQIVDLLRVTEAARLGNKYLYGSPTQTNQAIDQAMEAASGVVEDLAVGNRAGLIRKGVEKALGAFKPNREEYNRELLNLFTSPQGMELLNEAVARQKALLGAPSATQAVAPVVSAPTAGLTVGAISAQNQPASVVRQPPASLAVTPATANMAEQRRRYRELPPGFVPMQRGQ